MRQAFHSDRVLIWLMNLSDDEGGFRQH